jgi:hypothetical protein
MLTDERRAKIQEMRDDSRWFLAPAVRGALYELLAEIDRLNEAASDSSELAATTIAGLEMEVGKLRAENKVLGAERDAILNLCVHTSYVFEREYVAFTGDFRDIPMARLMRAGNQTEAVSWVRKAAGLDPIFGSPVPPADGGPDA